MMQKPTRHGTGVIGRMGMTAAALLGGCAQLPPMPQAPAHLLQPASAAATPPYRIRIGDKLAIKMPLNPELDQPVTVLPDGSISTNGVRRQEAAGMTVPDLDAALQQDYTKLLNNPLVYVAVTKSAPIPVYIIGAIERPGRYEFDGAVPRLAQAIAVAGGLKLGANPSEIFILRHLPDGKEQFFATRFADLRRGRDPEANVPLAASDEIFVPRTPISRAYGYFNQYIQQFVFTSANVNYQVNSSGTSSIIPAR